MLIINLLTVFARILHNKIIFEEKSMVLWSQLRIYSFGSVFIGLIQCQYTTLTLIITSTLLHVILSCKCSKSMCFRQKSSILFLQSAYNFLNNHKRWEHHMQSVVITRSVLMCQYHNFFFFFFVIFVCFCFCFC